MFSEDYGCRFLGPCSGLIMEGMASVRTYQQSMEELKHALLCTTMELQSAQLAAKEEKRKNEENVKQLLELLKATFKERDEAKDQLQQLLNKIRQSSRTELCQVLNLQPESPPAIPAIGNSSITDSDSLSGSHNRHSFVSSPVDSFFDAVSSPDLPNINMAESSSLGMLNPPLPLEYNNSSCLMGNSLGNAQIDPATAIIDQLAMRKPLPLKGKMLKTVMDAGPLLQTLLVAGPLPQWRNPPPLQPFKIPPVLIHATPQVGSTSMVDFSGTVGSCVKKRPMGSSCVGNEFITELSPTGKHQKLQ